MYFFLLYHCCCCCCNRGDTLMCQNLLRTRKLCQSPTPGHFCNSGNFHGASPRCFPYTTVCQLTQPVEGYTALDTALELCLQSGTGKLIPLLPDAGTSACTRTPHKQMGFSKTSPIATQVLQHKCNQ